jgi:hypothetical protein
MRLIDIVVPVLLIVSCKISKDETVPVEIVPPVEVTTPVEGTDVTPTTEGTDVVPTTTETKAPTVVTPGEELDTPADATVPAPAPVEIPPAK